MTLILDAGAFIALERGNDQFHARLRSERDAAQPPMTHGGIVGQVWRDGSRQVVLARALRHTTIVPLSAGLGRDAGRLLALTGGRDVIDAALVALAQDGDRIVTSDPKDLAHLLIASGINAALLVV